MIAAILPEGVAVDWTRAGARASRLFPEEEMVVARAVGKRQREFQAGRACARAALARLAVRPQPVPSGARGEPVWPPGIVGSITHCDGYCACGVGWRTEFASLGIDAEPDAPLPADVLEAIASPAERRAIGTLQASLPGVSWDRLGFSAKESVFKAWFQLTGHGLGYDKASLEIDPSTGTFAARIETRAAGRGPAGEAPVLRGRWTVSRGILLTAIAVRPGGPGVH